MRWCLLFLPLLFAGCTTLSGTRSGKNGIRFFPAGSKEFRYVGRFDLSHKKKPRCWNPGAYMEVGFSGTFLEIEIDDEMRYGGHNYIGIVLDGVPKRIKLTANKNVILVSDSLADKPHTLLICKNTESAMGYIEFAGISCRELISLPAKKRRIELIGDSITCGNGCDTTDIGCGQGTWYDQHNAYLSFGPTVARRFNADWQLSSVSGIGMTRSCCGLETTMPKVFGKINFDEEGPDWNFPTDDSSEPHVLVITLGQNDGIQDSTAYCTAYVAFVRKVRSIYRKSTIVCCTSPMANKKLKEQLNNYIPAISAELHRRGDLNVHDFLYRRSYRSGCFFHPTLSEHEQMAEELIPFIGKVTGWN
jgi:hypothetical protein